MREGGTACPHPLPAVHTVHRTDPFLGRTCYGSTRFSLMACAAA